MQPQLTTGYLYRLHFINANEGWIGADSGKIFHTIDGGNTWNVLNTGSPSGIGGIFFLSSTHGWAIGGPSTSIYRTTDGGATWNSSFPGSSYSLQDVWFTSTTEGCAVGFHGSFYKTTNGGASWTNVSGTSIRDVHSVYFANANYGYASADDGYFFTTFDGGNSWGYTASATGGSLTGTFAFPNGDFYLVGQKGAIFRNGNLADPKSNLGNSLIVWSTWFDTNLHGYAVGGSPAFEAVVWETTDAGENWIHSEPFGTVNKQLKSVHINSNGNFYMGGDGGLFCNDPMGFTCQTNPSWGVINSITSYGFNYWSGGTKIISGGIIQNSPANQVNSIYFVSANNGWAAGNNGSILSTNDQGLTWNSQASGTTMHLNGICFANINEGWAVGDSGTILYTADGGVSWNAQTGNLFNDLRSVSFATNLKGIAVGDEGTILHTNDGGVNWQTEFSTTRSQLYSVHFKNPSSCWIVGNSGILLSLDTTVVFAGIHQLQTEKRKMWVYPNPASDFITIKTSELFNDELLIEIYNSIGQLELTVTKTVFQNTSVTIENLNLKKGLYYLNIKGKTFVANDKFLVN